MSEASLRRLVDVAATACGLTDDAHVLELVAVDAVELAEFGASSVVEKARLRNATFTSAVDATTPSLETLVVTSISRACRPMLWVVDGWAAIRAYGCAIDLRCAKLAGADLAGADLRGADLSEADLSRADLTKADLTGAILIGACLAGASLFSTSLKDTNLTEADFCRADLRHADLRGATCKRTAFRGADLWGTYLWKVDVSEAFVEGVDLSRSDYLAEKVQS